MTLDSTATARELADTLMAFVRLTAGDSDAHSEVDVTISVPGTEPIPVGMPAVTAAWLQDAVQAEIDSLNRGRWRD